MPTKDACVQREDPGRAGNGDNQRHRWPALLPGRRSCSARSAPPPGAAARGHQIGWIACHEGPASALPQPERESQRQDQRRRHRAGEVRSPAPPRPGTSPTARPTASVAGRPCRPRPRPAAPTPRSAGWRRPGPGSTSNGERVDQQPLRPDGLHPGADVRRELRNPQGPEHAVGQRRPRRGWNRPIQSTGRHGSIDTAASATRRHPFHPPQVSQPHDHRSNFLCTRECVPHLSRRRRALRRGRRLIRRRSSSTPSVMRCNGSG